MVCTSATLSRINGHFAQKDLEMGEKLLAVELSKMHIFMLLFSYRKKICNKSSF